MFFHDAPAKNNRDGANTGHGNCHAPHITQGLPSFVKGSPDEGEESDLTCLFDRRRHHALMSRAGARLAAWADLAVLGNVAAEQVRLFIVNCQGFVCTKLTGFGLCKEAAFSTAFLLCPLGSSIVSH
jgi:hypothetical protein